MASDKQSLEEKLIDWLGSEGYRLEYLAHKAFVDAGVKSVLGHYVESSEGKPREIDVMAFLATSGRDPVLLARVLCECKYSRRQPWVLLASGLNPDLFLDWYSTPQSRSVREHSHRVDQYADVLHQCWHFAEGHKLAHNLLQAFGSKNRDTAFNSLQKIANAAWDCVETAERRGKEAHVVAFPCLVVDAPLYFAWFDFEADQFAVKRVPYGRVSWSGCRSGTLVDVVHADALSDYAEATRNTFERVLQVVEGLLTGLR